MGLGAADRAVDGSGVSGTHVTAFRAAGACVLVVSTHPTYLYHEPHSGQ